MKILRGKHAGKAGRVRQYANDWMTVDLADGTRGVIVKPAMVQLLDEEDRQRLAVRDPKVVGRFWAEWRLNDDGTFTALRERAPRRAL